MKVRDSPQREETLPSGRRLSGASEQELAPRQCNRDTARLRCDNSRASILKIAKPLLLVSTPVGVVWGVVEAYRFHPWLAGLMAVLLAIISAFIGYTVQVIRRESKHERAQQINAAASTARHNHELE